MDDAKTAIAENLQKLRDGEIEYEDAKAEAEKALADARAQIEDGEAALNDVEYPTWYVWDRSKNVSYASFTANVDKLTAITTIFPVFFFLVAALGGIHHHDPHGRGRTPTDRHAESPGLFGRSHHAKVPDLRLHGGCSGHSSRTGRRLQGLPVHHLVRL